MWAAWEKALALALPPPWGVALVVAFLPHRTKRPPHALKIRFRVSPVPPKHTHLSSPCIRGVRGRSSLTRSSVRSQHQTGTISSVKRGPVQALAQIAPCSSEFCANKTDASLTLMGLSLLEDRAVGQFGIPVVSISITYELVWRITDLARFLHIRVSRGQFEIRPGRRDQLEWPIARRRHLDRCQTALERLESRGQRVADSL